MRKALAIFHFLEIGGGKEPFLSGAGNGKPKDELPLRSISNNKGGRDSRPRRAFDTLLTERSSLRATQYVLEKDG